MADRQALEKLFRNHGHENFTWIEPSKIVVAHWVRMKCRFGCEDYGRNAVCPPNAPSVEDCRRFFDEYSEVAVFHSQKHFERPKERYNWTKSLDEELLELEKAVFLAGYVKAFLLFTGGCRFCSECPTTRAECLRPDLARPTAEGLAMDVFSTVRQYGLPIQVLSSYDEPMNRYGFLLVD
jgi:predicted metal-binding protein